MRGLLNYKPKTIWSNAVFFETLPIIYKHKKMHLHIDMFKKKTYFENSDNILRELHQRRARDPPVDPVHEDARADRMRNRPELRLLVRLPLGRRQLPREGGSQPLPDLRRDRVRLDLRQLIVLVRQPPAHTQ